MLLQSADRTQIYPIDTAQLEAFHGKIKKKKEGTKKRNKPVKFSNLLCSLHYYNIPSEQETMAMIR